MIFSDTKDEKTTYNGMLILHAIQLDAGIRAQKSDCTLDLSIWRKVQQCLQNGRR